MRSFMSWALRGLSRLLASTGRRCGIPLITVHDCRLPEQLSSLSRADLMFHMHFRDRARSLQPPFPRECVKASVLAYLL